MLASKLHLKNCTVEWHYSVSMSLGRIFYVAVGGGIAQYAWCHIKNIIEDNRFNCQLIDKSEDMGMLSIQGPKR